MQVKIGEVWNPLAARYDAEIILHAETEGEVKALERLLRGEEPYDFHNHGEFWHLQQDRTGKSLTLTLGSRPEKRTR